MKDVMSLANIYTNNQLCRDRLHKWVWLKQEMYKRGEHYACDSEFCGSSCPNSAVFKKKKNQMLVRFYFHILSLFLLRTIKTKNEIEY
jgi:hypothetical protein